jgi:YHS domain-containing protein
MLCTLGLLTLGLTLPLRAAPAGALNLDRNGLAVQGYDPVAFFTSPKPVKGLPSITSTRDGATYRFATAEHKAAFDANPAKYEPAFGGYCAYGVSKGKKVEVDVDAFQIVNGRLLLQYSKGVREKFNQDTQGNLKLADAKWADVSKLPK